MCHVFLIVYVCVLPLKGGSSALPYLEKCGEGRGGRSHGHTAVSKATKSARSISRQSRGFKSGLPAHGGNMPTNFTVVRVKDARGAQRSPSEDNVLREEDEEATVQHLKSCKFGIKSPVVKSRTQTLFGGEVKVQRRACEPVLLVIVFGER
uniref:Uncharacterized protein n=1 Tax=Knipowitschia caucasica TaxID=637954 RepID=A0AAV2JG99_KNICA